MTQKPIYKLVKTWLEDKGFEVLITGANTTFVIPISDLVSLPYKIPDLVGVSNDDKVVIVEVEQNKKRLFDSVGRCMLWRCMATFVYLAYPKGEISAAPFLEKIGLGLLQVDEKLEFVTESIALPQERHSLIKISELHPTDFQKESQLAKQIRAIKKMNYHFE